MIYDFSKCKKSNKYYGGSERKIGIIISGEEYMLKFQKYSTFGEKIYNHVSEYIGSHIFELLGLNVQKTYLGLYNGEEVVACKNFINNDDKFVPFNDVGETTLDHKTDDYQYSYLDIMKMLQDNSKLTNLTETIYVFWDMFIIDALIGNFDRHGSNWGFIKRKGRYYLAPIFDNGSCLFPQMNNYDEMEKIINSSEETNKRIFQFPTSQIKINGKKTSYYEVINSMSFSECNEALIRIVERFDLEKINKLIDGTVFINDIHRMFYKHMIKERFEKILLSTYLKLKER